jgi:hypothetical protein
VDTLQTVEVIPQLFHIKWQRRVDRNFITGKLDLLFSDLSNRSRLLPHLKGFRRNVFNPTPLRHLVRW